METDMKHANVSLYVCDNKIEHKPDTEVAVVESVDDIPESWVEVYGVEPEGQHYCSLRCAWHALMDEHQRRKGVEKVEA